VGSIKQVHYCHNCEVKVIIVSEQKNCAVFCKKCTKELFNLGVPVDKKDEKE
jgi:hypothetical protein